jgi:mRNA interferase MazF
LVKSKYCPDAGDLIWLSFHPQAGHEQAGRRPALVISPLAYNAKSGLALVCPITSRPKNYPFEVAIDQASEIAGVILADQVKSIDWKARQATKIGLCPAAALEQVTGKIAALIGI